MQALNSHSDPNAARTPLQRLDFLLHGRPPYSWSPEMGISNGGMGRLREGKFPDPERLEVALRAENISLTWWLTGQGQPYVVTLPRSNHPNRCMPLLDEHRKCWILRHDTGPPAAVLERECEVTLPPSRNQEPVHREFTASMVLGWLMSRADLDTIQRSGITCTTHSVGTGDVLPLIRGQAPWWKLRERLQSSDQTSREERLHAGETPADYAADVAQGAIEQEDWWREMSTAERRAILGFVDVLMDRKGG